MTRSWLEIERPIRQLLFGLIRGFTVPEPLREGLLALQNLMLFDEPVNDLAREPLPWELELHSGDRFDAQVLRVRKARASAPPVPAPSAAGPTLVDTLRSPPPEPLGPQQYLVFAVGLDRSRTALDRAQVQELHRYLEAWLDAGNVTTPEDDGPGGWVPGGLY